METVAINTITPVHVGNGRFLTSGTEYVFSKEGNIGIVDESSILDLIGNENVHLWVNAIDKNQPLNQLLNQLNVKASLKKISKRVLAGCSETNRAKKLTTLKEQLHNGQGLPYIPGSSIKGAIRSALFNHLIRNGRHPLSDSKLKNKFGKYSANYIEKDFFGKDPNHDIFRFLRIGDAHFPENSTIALIMDNLNLKGDPNDPYPQHDKSKNQLVEAIGKDKKALLNIKIDKTGISQNLKNRSITSFPESFQNLRSLFQLINNNTKLLIKEEIDFWSEYKSEETERFTSELEKLLEQTKCDQNECILRLSHGSGWTFINGNWVNLQDIVTDESYYGIVNSSRPGNINNYSNYPFPKSRRISNDFDLMGFVKLRIVNDK